MAATTVENRPSESERSIARKIEHEPFFGNSTFSTMRRLSEEMNRAFDSVFGGISGFGNSGLWSPAIDVRERNGSIEIDAELPGLTKDDVKVESTEEGILIEGEKRREHEETREGFRRSERSYGSFSRWIAVPKGAQTDKATAEFKNGMLHVRIPVPENRQQRRKIPIAA
ncbi:MAG TPA: Hsp20/alpha crystallin family protein [Bryobacteraceae bacterium]|nr:Hsp20/alpha crystallin family protein [Bryobacteraceae bacterium]